MTLKRDINDAKFSKYKRMNRKVCQKCGQAAKLQCCHIFSRKYYSTRFHPDNAVVLCYACHNWFDTHKITACLGDETKRVFTAEDESFHFLVSQCGYEWEQLCELYHLSQQPYRGYKHKKKEISKQLDEMIANNI